jgi:hypothetical protein
MHKHKQKRAVGKGSGGGKHPSHPSHEGFAKNMRGLEGAHSAGHERLHHSSVKGGASTAKRRAKRLEGKPM